MTESEADKAMQFIADIDTNILGDIDLAPAMLQLAYENWLAVEERVERFLFWQEMKAEKTTFDARSLAADYR